MSEVRHATVKWFNGEKGYGFITDDETGSDLFVHFSDVQKSGFKTLDEKESVTYVKEESDRGPKATLVTPV